MSKVETIYFVEGECEKNFINSFKTNRAIISGKVRITNLWETANINRIIRSLPKQGAVIYVAFDTDVTSEAERFCANIKALSKHCRKIILLPQHEHFEDELAFACQQATRDLPSYLYGLSSLSECKTKLAQDKNLVSNLNAKGFVLARMWSRTDIIEQLILPKNNIQWGIEYVLTD
ncbi:hypothetical protein [Leucothrix pacifica]|uniref:DUF4435 domain-containing protein n=1 Tax=Leucothrix pacifica TaxID=1247513 RepID=A0A317CEN0_9GAMM|nr:hypothetical protein [Leucothrix pacifica]PWQ96541.1 hypothetical protein DKW60_12200 [Leucothrix pacifica]